MTADDRSDERAVTPPVTPSAAGESDWQRPPFESENDAALVHGSYSPAKIAERAERVHAELLSVCPWLDEDRYAVSVQRYLQAAARESLADAALTDRGVGAKGGARLLEVATAASRLAWRMADELGLTPAGHARLKVLVADSVEAEQSLADLAAEGAAIRQRRDAEDAAAVDVEAVDQ